jgi:post-segregation antitoxin (ccd killing protein)
MNAPFAPKRHVQLELDEALVQRAEALGQSMSSMVEQALRRYVAEQENVTRETFRAEAEAHARFTNTLIEKYGYWGEEFRTL